MNRRDISTTTRTIWRNKEWEVVGDLCILGNSSSQPHASPPSSSQEYPLGRCAPLYFALGNEGIPHHHKNKGKDLGVQRILYFGDRKSFR